MHAIRALLLLVLLVPIAASAWWNESWAERKTIAIDTSATGLNLTEPVKDVTVLLRLHGGNFPGFLTVREGGADFRLIAGDDMTPLAHHVERFDPVTQMALIWVKLPSLAPQSTEEKIYLYYSNPEALGAEQVAETFDSVTVAAFHFADASAPVDSSAAGTTIERGSVFPNPASLIGGGANFPGTEPLVLADNGALTLDPAEGYTLSTWFRFAAAPAAPVALLDRGENALRISVTGDTVSANVGGTVLSSASPAPAAQWHHVALTVSASDASLYVDGVLAQTLPVTATATSGPLAIGGTLTGTALATVELDELVIARAARSAAFITATVALEGERNDAVVAYGAVETAAGGGEHGAEEGHGSGHFAAIWNSVFGPGGPMIERVVIIICGIMMVVAVAVIFFKTAMLMRARSATSRFEKAYRKLPLGSTDPDLQFGALTGRRKRFGASPLYQVYLVAVEQVASRQGSPSVGASQAGFDAKTIKSIQAGMDSRMVRESQRLNSWMVMLTIAISGGPFIGLLGTVVGVMTTFGAIAATGDINITAIAPGMAAALLATVAGLGVAIPALFGYNYLGSLIKGLSADMSVFSDEITARITEEFGA